MLDYGPNIPKTEAAKYSRADITAIAQNKLHLPFRRCIKKHNDEQYCICEATWEDGGSEGANPCNFTTKAKPVEKTVVAPKPVAPKPVAPKPGQVTVA